MKLCPPHSVCPHTAKRLPNAGARGLDGPADGLGRLRAAPRVAWGPAGCLRSGRQGWGPGCEGGTSPPPTTRPKRAATWRPHQVAPAPAARALPREARSWRVHHFSGGERGTELF